MKIGIEAWKMLAGGMNIAKSHSDAVAIGAIVQLRWTLRGVCVAELIHQGDKAVSASEFSLF